MNFADIQGVKLHNSIYPQSINDTATTGTGVDTTGYAWAFCIFTAGAIGAANFTKISVQESDTNGSYADITGATLGTVGDSSDNTSYGVFIDLRKRKKWITWYADPGAVACLMDAKIILGGAVEVADSATERGLTEQYIV